MNGYELDPPNVEEGEAFVLAVAQDSHEVPEIAKVLATWITPFG